MKAELKITFLKINNVPVTESLLKQVPQLKQSTEKTMEIMCKKLEQYFKESKIEVKTEFKLK
jgi:hypothetical protein